MATIEVDGKILEAEPGQMLIEVTDAAGIYIPRFCYHEKLSIAANCRMCLVDVEKAPKPLPACATPISDGMKVQTRSELAKTAQQGTMEFLLINHPLDCPVCDQGGECPLQDQAMGYGKSDSRFKEKKRVVASKNIGPLIATEMTRCIHCTRCVRFGEEVAGVMEMGAPGRGEFTKITTFLGGSIDSEVSGNMIDLCPVGALTSKPSRFVARSWEMQGFAGVSPHDCVGTTLQVQTLRKEVRRVLPENNLATNDCWLADRDRYSFEAVNSEQRLLKPMIKGADGWQETDWQSALQHTVAGIQTVINQHGAAAVGALAGSSCSVEEYYLLQQLVRKLGSDNVDHRSNISDFSDDADAPLFPSSSLAINAIDKLDAALLIGSNIRKEQPLLSLRLRQAVLKNNATVSALSTLEHDFNFATSANLGCAPADLLPALCQSAKRIAEITGQTIDSAVTALANPDYDLGDATYQQLVKGASSAIMLGAIAQQHPQAAAIKAVANWIATQTNSELCVFAQGNSAGAWLVGAVPHRGPRGATIAKPGKNAADMMNDVPAAMILLDCEPEADAVDGKRALAAMHDSHFVISINAFDNPHARQYADVMLPAAALFEDGGGFVNCNGLLQHALTAAPPKGEARPAWKILRVMGNFLQLDGFEYIKLDDVRAELDLAEQSDQAGAQYPLRSEAMVATSASSGLQQIRQHSMYRIDSTLRRADALQSTADNHAAVAVLHPATAASMGLAAQDQISINDGASNSGLPISLNARVPQGCVFIPAGIDATLTIAANASIEVAKA